MCWEEEAEKSGVSVAEALGQVKVGDKIRILRTGNDNDGEDRDGWEHHLFEKGQIVEVVNVSTLPAYVIAKGVSRLSGCVDTITEQGIHPLDFEAVKDEVTSTPSLTLPKKGDIVCVVTQHDVLERTKKEGGKYIGWHAFQIGDEVEVDDIRADGAIHAIRRYDNLPQEIHLDDYELISKEASTEASDSDDEAWATLAVPKPERKFKVGDRVETKNGGGTIVFITDNGEKPYLVEHDYWFDGHDGNEIEGAPTLEDENGWYYWEEELELLKASEASGEEIRPGLSIGDKVRVLTDGESSEGNETTLVGWHNFEEGEIVEVVGRGFDYNPDAVEAIIVKRPKDNDWQTQVLYRDDYEKVEDTPSAPASDSDLPADLLEPAALRLLMLELAMLPIRLHLLDKGVKVEQFVSSLQFILKDFARYQKTGELNPALQAYLKG